MKKAPDAFRTISEVSEWLETPAHVLRFWESKFSQIKPVKRAGGRRYYRPDDMRLLGGIKQMLHIDGLTIKGAQKVLREKGIKHVVGLSPAVTSTDTGQDAEQNSDIDSLTSQINTSVAEVASAPAAPLVLDASTMASPDPTPEQEVFFTQPLSESAATENPVVFDVPETSANEAVDMNNNEATLDGSEVEIGDTDPAIDSATPPQAKAEDISKLYGRLKSLRRRMRDPQ
jgi:DNA-binding transcriptional MerR regulator